MTSSLGVRVAAYNEHNGLITRPLNKHLMRDKHRHRVKYCLFNQIASLLGGEKSIIKLSRIEGGIKA